MNLSTTEAVDLDDTLASNTSLRIAISSGNRTMAIALRDGIRARLRQRPEAVIVADDLAALAANATLLAGIVVQDDADLLQVSLRMRRESLPDVNLVDDGMADAGLDLQHCRMYVDSMFASLQVTVSAALVSVVGRSGSYTLPASVRVRAYPTAARAFDPFRGRLDAIAGLYLITAFIGLATKFLFVLVQEKAGGRRQYLKVMGVSTAAIWASWTLVYAGLCLITSLLSAAILIVSGALFPVSVTGDLVLLILLYCLALMAFALLSSVFFDQAKSAAQFSGLVVFLLYSPRLIVSDLDSGIARILSPPLAFEYGFRQLIRDGASSAGVLLVLSLYAIGVAVLALYLDRIVPSEFGVRQSSLLPCRRIHRPRRLQHVADEEVSLEPLMERRPSAPETAVSPGPVSVLRVRHVSKSYGASWPAGRNVGPSSGNVQALVDVSFDLRRDQISTLLGHNGAGKSTLMAILSGLIEADTGQAILDGALDLLNPAESAGVRIGICLQSDLLFPDLTVIEHVELCAALRSVSVSSCQPLLDALGIGSSGTSIASTLSPGMRRRLSVALAFIGNPEIVFLDEPSSGMDPVGREALWRALQQWKAGRFLILTTHSMDGADLLSDAVVIMDGGRVAACASPDALKRAHAPGYLLAVTVPECVAEAVCSQVARHIPDAVVRVRTPNQVAFLLPDRHLDRFAPMLQSLNALDRVESFGLTVRSLEEVFLNLLYGSDHQRQRPQVEPRVVPVPCQPSTTAQLRALIAAFATCWLHDWRALVYQLVMPALYLALGLGFRGVQSESRDGPVAWRSFSDPLIFANRSVVITSMIPWATTLAAFGLEGIAISNPSPDRALFDHAPTSLAIDLNGHLYHNCSSLHALPAGLALMASAALSRRVEFRSEPFPAPTRASPSLIVLLMIVAGLAYVPVGFGIALIRQRGSRRRLTISGLRSTTFWTARLGLDLCLYLIPGILIIGAAVLARTLPLPSPSAIVILIVGLGVNGAVVLAFNGWVTSRIESLPAYSAWASILYLFESMALLVVSELDLGLIPDLLLTPWPNFVLSRTLVAIGTGTDAGLFALLPIYAMAVSAALFWFLLILRSDRRPDPSPIRRRSGPPPPISPTRPPDPDVAQEANEIVAHYADTNRYQVCLDRIQVGEDSYRIVRGVSFGIGRGQVLGLLGPNGAGKSTLARCMVGSIRPEGGRGRLLNLDLAQDRDQISQVMGYVPQEDDDLLPSLSASQHLHLFAHIKGVPQAEVDGVCKRLIRQLDLGSCADRPTRTYSGGTRRKLSLGLALLGNVPVLVLDEPTNGLDAHARRLAWDLIASWTPGAGTLLVTHDTREAERLGDRIAIMCDGRLQCLGTATHLKGRYASSYQVDLTLMDDGAGHVQAVLDALEEQGVSEPVQVRTRAGARARLQTGNLDRVHVPVLFAVLAGLQAQGRIRDFAVAQCSLDDVLLGFVER